MSGLETFGHCLLVFKVLPSIDAVRGMMLLSCIGFLPGLTRLIFGKEDRHSSWAIPRKIALVIAVIIQLTGPVVVLIFSYGWHSMTPVEPSTYAKNSHSHYVREAARWSMESLNQICKWVLCLSLSGNFILFIAYFTNYSCAVLNWEVILAVLLTNLSWCENFLEKNRTVCGKSLSPTHYIYPSMKL